MEDNMTLVAEKAKDIAWTILFMLVSALCFIVLLEYMTARTINDALLRGLILLLQVF